MVKKGVGFYHILGNKGKELKKIGAIYFETHSITAFLYLAI